MLHINDNTDDQVLFQAACRRAGLPVYWHVCETAARGISYLKSLAELSPTEPVQWPDLVLLDIAMPGEDGFVVLEYIRSREELRHLTVVMWTGLDSPQLQQEAYRLGANSFMVKPMGLDATVERVKQIYARWLAAPPGV